MATTDIDLCNRALILLGDDEISSFDDETDAATICGRTYPGLRNSYLSKYPWRFASKRAALTREMPVPLGARYSFVLPSDKLKGGAFQAFNVESPYAAPFTDWDIRGNRLLSNADQVWISYSIEADENDFPEYFAEFLVAALCSRIAYPITDQQNVAADWQARAFGMPSEMGEGGLLGAALIADAQQHPAPAFFGDYDLITARF